MHRSVSPGFQLREPDAESRRKTLDGNAWQISVHLRTHSTLFMSSIQMSTLFSQWPDALFTGILLKGLKIKFVT